MIGGNQFANLLVIVVSHVSLAIISPWFTLAFHRLSPSITKRGKERTFHSLSPSITSTLTFQPCITLFPITRSKRNGKYKEEEEKKIKLNYPKLQHGKKTTLLSVYLPEEEPQGVFLGTR